MAAVEFLLECLPEDVEIEGNAMASGDSSADEEANTWIRTELEAGNPWAWFCAKVTASVEIDGETFTGTDYLGCCSYKSEEDFRADAYFADMKSAALDALRDTIRKAIKRGVVAQSALSKVRKAGVL